MILKASKMGFEKENHDSTDYVHCCVIGCHGNHFVAFGLNIYVRDFGGGGDLKKNFKSISQ